MSPLPLTHLTLRLSSPSFLETILTHDGQPCYSTETFENSTSLSRCDPVRGLVLVANIRWPEHENPKGKSREPSVPKVMMDGWLKSEDDLLRRNCLNTSRKFNVPGHSHALKWKRVQGVFQCMSSCGTPVAVFEPAHLTARARLNIFEPSLPGLPNAQGTGVSTILVDYLLVTALLLVTHPEDWRGFCPSPVMAITELPRLHTSQSTRPLTPSYSTPVSPITSSFSESCHTANASPRTFAAQVKEDAVVDYELPPPYEEIQWTVRVPQPRRRHA